MGLESDPGLPFLGFVLFSGGKPLNFQGVNGHPNIELEGVDGQAFGVGPPKFNTSNLRI